MSHREPMPWLQLHRDAAPATRRLACIGLAALLAGCTSLTPPYEQPPLPVAERFPDVADPNTPVLPSALAATDIAWQNFFSDPKLKALIELALLNNRDLRVAILNIEQARAQWQVQRADQVPGVNAGAIVTSESNTKGGSTTAYVAGLNVPSFELDFFGRVNSLSEAALAQYLATEEARKTAQIILVAAVANAYLAVHADQEQLALTQQTLASRVASLQLTQLKLDNGIVSELDLAQSQSLVAGARVALQVLKRQRLQNENALVLLVGQPVQSDLRPETSLMGLSIGPELPAGLPSDLLLNRPDIRQSEQQLRSANANIGAARAAFYPRITLTGGAGVASGNLLDLFKAGTFAWAFTPQIVLPLFDGGRNQANLDAAKAQRDITIAQYEKTVQTAFREVADALAGRATLTEQLKAQQAQADAEAARYRLSNLRYTSGVSSYLDALDAQRSLFLAQLATVQVQLSRLQNQVRLYQVLGGGWTEPATN